MSGRTTRWWAERGLLVAASLALVLGAAVEAPAGRVLFVVAGGGMSLLVGLAWYRDEVGMREALVVAALLRLIAFPLLPGLSDDGFRYLWDGLLQAEGISPYAFRPSDPALAGFRDGGLFDRLNSADYYSVYPPASQLVFLPGGWLGWPLGWYAVKAIFVGAELAGVWALSRMTAPRWVLVYAWHPLAVIEVAGQGHTEGAMVGFVLLALLAYRRSKPAASVAALTTAGWFKLYPLVLLPFLLQRVGWRYGWAAAAVSAVFVMPYASPDAVSHVRESLDLYVRSFEFYAGPYYALKEVGRLLTGEDVSKVLGPALRMVFLAGVGVLVLADQSRQWSLPAVWLAALTLLWATATTVHPWYLLSVLALLPLAAPERSASRSIAVWYALAFGAMATYLLYTHGAGPYWAAVWLGWTAWSFCWLYNQLNPLLQYKLRKRARKKARWLAPHLFAAARVLDLGAGEGYVGEELHRTTGAEVVLADVGATNRTLLPHVTYDGRQLPFEDASFDATVLVFVLHHAEDPEAVLREARRVTRGPVLVIESVFEGVWDRRWLEAADRFANRVRGSETMRAQEAHLGFRTVGEWQAVFHSAGLDSRYESRRGGWWHRQHLFVLEAI